MVFQIDLEMVEALSSLPELLSLYWNEQLTSAFPKLWMVLHEQMSSHMAVRSSELGLPSRGSRDKCGIVSLGRALILAHEGRAKIESNSGALWFELRYLGSNIPVPDVGELLREASRID